METLAYLDMALAYEEANYTTPAENLDSLKHLEKSNGQTLSSYARIYLPSLFVLLSMFPMTGEALAQILKEGDRNPAVSELQYHLQQLGYFYQQPTGYFGSITKDAVMRFQQAKGLRSDGVVGQDTWGALVSELDLHSIYNNDPYSPQPNYPQPLTNNPNFLPPGRTSVQVLPPPSVSSQFTPPRNLPNSRYAQEVPEVHSTRTLYPGDRGPLVEQLQYALRIAGVDLNENSGFYGPETESAVKEFQRWHNLQVDGVADWQTLTRLGLPCDNSISIGGGQPDSPYTPEPNPSSRITLYPGDRGPKIEQLQQALREAGFDPGGRSGFYGPETESAVREFQTYHNLQVNGIADWETLIALGLLPKSFTFQSPNSSNSGSTSQVSPIYFRRTLHPGDRGSEVLLLKQKLEYAGYPPDSSDDRYDRQTEYAVKEFQSANGLSIDGIAGKETLAALDRITKDFSDRTNIPLSRDY